MKKPEVRCILSLLTLASAAMLEVGQVPCDLITSLNVRPSQSGAALERLFQSVEFKILTLSSAVHGLDDKW